MAQIEYLIVAGGGAAGLGTGGAAGRGGGGGGAGGLLEGTFQISSLLSLAVTVGAGAPWTVSQVQGASGGNSSIAGIATAIGGGGGATGNIVNGQSGGSGGGGSGVPPGSQSFGGAGTSGQGFGGGGALNRGGGGGGGRGGAGGTSGVDFGDRHGAGYVSSITGTAVEYSRGGAGGNWSSSESGWVNGVAGAGYGWGGSGGTSDADDASAGGGGGQGIVVIRYLKGTMEATGGNSVYQSGNYMVHIFTSSGTFRVTSIGGGFLAFF